MLLKVKDMVKQMESDGYNSEVQKFQCHAEALHDDYLKM